jgi:hypothetical protein
MTCGRFKDPCVCSSGLTGGAAEVRSPIIVSCRGRVGETARDDIRVMLAWDVESAPSRCFPKRSSA